MQVGTVTLTHSPFKTRVALADMPDGVLCVVMSPYSGAYIVRQRKGKVVAFPPTEFSVIQRLDGQPLPSIKPPLPATWNEAEEGRVYETILGEPVFKQGEHLVSILTPTLLVSPNLTSMQIVRTTDYTATRITTNI